MSGGSSRVRAAVSKTAGEGSIPSPRVIGLDLSPNASGMAWESGVLCLDLKPKQHTGARRLQAIRNVVHRLATTPKPANLAVIEAYAYTASHLAMTIAEVGGVVRLALLDAGVPYAEVAPLSLKKFATGSGSTRGATRVTKDHVIRTAREYLGYVGANDNEADAMWLRTVGLARLGLFDVDVLPWRLRALEVISAVEWPRSVRETPRPRLSA